MEPQTQPTFGLNDAVRIAEGYKEIDSNLAQSEAFVMQQLQDASERDYEKRAQMYYYLLQLILRKNLNFETPMAEKYYTNMHEQFLLAVGDMQKQLRDNKDNRQVAMLASQLKAFYKLIEKFYGALYRVYSQKSFCEAKERVYVHRMQYRLARYQLEGRYSRVSSLWLFEKVSNFGTSYGRWLAVAGSVIVFGGLALALHDVVSMQRIVQDGGIMGVEYLFLSASLMTLSGPLLVGTGGTLVAKSIMTMIALLGYGLLAALVHLLIKRM